MSWHHTFPHYDWTFQSQRNDLVSNFRVHFSRLMELLPVWYPEWRRFNQGGEGKFSEVRRPNNSDSFRKPCPMLTATELVDTACSVCVLIHRFHVKTGAVNFGRGAVVSPRPPYFHTQGGLQKNVGGATCDVTFVRGTLLWSWRGFTNCSDTNLGRLISYSQ